MKNLLLISFVLISFSIFANGPVFPYAKYDMKFYFNVVSKPTTPQEIEFCKVMVKKLSMTLKDTLRVKDENLPWFFNKYVKFEERFFDAGRYNSGWNSETGKIEPCHGEQQEFTVGVCRIGTYEVVLFKRSCGNPMFLPEDEVIKTSSLQNKTNEDKKEWVDRSRSTSGDEDKDNVGLNGGHTNVTINNYYGGIEKTIQNDEFPKYPTPSFTDNHYKTVNWECAYCGKVMHKNILLEHVRDHQRGDEYNNEDYNVRVSDNVQCSQKGLSVGEALLISLFAPTHYYRRGGYGGSPYLNGDHHRHTRYCRH